MIKQLIFFLLLLSISPVKAQQNLGSFVDSSNLWYNYGGSVAMYGTSQRLHIFYFFQGDTVIGSYNYKKMYYKSIDSTFNSNNGTLHHVTNYPVRLQASFRQEGQRVYAVRNYYNNNNEFVYIDFNMQVGDTVNYQPFGTTTQTVSAIDSIPFGNQYRRRFTTTGGTIYEGIGHQFGIFRNSSVGIEGGHYLSCFHQYDETQDVYYFNSNAPCYNYNSPTYNSQGATFICSTPTQCGGSSFAINASTAGYQSYQWNITGPGGYVSNHSGQNISVTLSQPGYYNVSLSATYNGITETHTETSYLNVIAQPTVTAPSSICLGSNGQLSPTSGGTWSSSNNSIASVTNLGYVYSNNQGNVTFTFIDAQTGCGRATPIVQIVNQYVSMPSTSMCVDGTIQLTPNNGGIWISNNPTVASITNTGLVTAHLQGIATFTFTNSITGCSQTTQNLTVNLGTNPIITVPASFCENESIQLSPTSGGSWNSSGPVWVSDEGYVSVFVPGTATFTFTNEINGCSTTSSSVEIFERPFLYMPSSDVCLNSSLQIITNPGYTWVSSNPSIASVSYNGTVTGLAPGNAYFTATNPSTGCSNSTNNLLVIQGPIVDPLPNIVVCANEIVSTIAFSGTSMQYTWSNNNLNIGLSSYGIDSISAFIATNNSSSNQVSNISVTPIGNYCGTPTTFSITVKPLPFVNAGNDTSFCIGQSYTLNAITNASSFSWNNNLQNGTILTPDSTSHFVVFVNENGCQNTDTIIVTVDPISSFVNAGNDTTICAYQPYTLNANTNSNSITWNNSLSNGTVINPSSTSQYIVVVGSIGCQNTDTILISTIPLPIVNTGNDTSICVGQSFTPYSFGNATAYQWSNGLIDGIAFIPSATTLLTLSGELDGCLATDSVLVSVSNPSLSIYSFNGEDSFSCDGTASVMVVNGIAPYSFAWTNNTEYYTTPSIQNLCSGIYSISIVDAIGCQGSSSVTINDTLIINQTSDTLYFTDIIYQDSTIISADTSDWIENCTFDYILVTGASIASFVSDGTSTTVNWLVNLNNGTNIPIDVVYPLNIGASGVYELTLQLFCSAKSDPKFIVATSQIYIDVSSIGIQSLSLNSVFLYPNPTTSTLSISGINSDFSYKISDLQGKLLKQGANDKQIEIENLPAGTYVIGISTDDMVKQLRFVKL